MKTAQSRAPVFTTPSAPMKGNEGIRRVKRNVRKEGREESKGIESGQLWRESKAGKVVRSLLPLGDLSSPSSKRETKKRSRREKEGFREKKRNEFTRDQLL